MSEQEYERLARAIVEAIQQQSEPRSPRATVDYLVDRVHVNREVLRATVSDLIVGGELQVTPDLRVTAPPIH
jgi:hypothetical protein